MILINGCSFTAAADNTDSWVKGFYNKEFTKYDNSTYDNQLEFQKNTIKNIAVGGSSNTVIRRKTFWYLNDRPYNILPDYAIIQWSTIDRWDYPVFVDEEKAKNFPRLDMNPHWVNKINYMNNGTQTLGFAKSFYENYYSYYGAVIETLENIYHTQKYLEEKNVPYKMITIGNLFDMDVSIKKLVELQTIKVNDDNGNYSSLKTNVKTIFEKLEPYEESWFELNNIKKLLNKIDFTKFLFTDDIRIDGFGGGIIEWFLNKNEMLTGGNWHPSEEQHLRFFNEFLWPRIESDIAVYRTKFM